MITSKRCVLTAVRASDVDHMVRLHGDENVRRYLGGTRSATTVRAGFAALRLRGFNPNEWIIRKQETNEFIGWIGLHDHHDGDDTEISYLLLPQWWGQGYGKEVV